MFMVSVGGKQSRDWNCFDKQGLNMNNTVFHKPVKISIVIFRIEL